MAEPPRGGFLVEPREDGPAEPVVGEVRQEPAGPRSRRSPTGTPGGPGTACGTGPDRTPRASATTRAARRPTGRRRARRSGGTPRGRPSPAPTAAPPDAGGRTPSPPPRRLQAAERGAEHRPRQDRRPARPERGRPPRRERGRVPRDGGRRAHADHGAGLGGDGRARTAFSASWETPARQHRPGPVARQPSPPRLPILSGGGITPDRQSRCERPRGRPRPRPQRDRPAGPGGRGVRGEAPPRDPRQPRQPARGGAEGPAGVGGGAGVGRRVARGGTRRSDLHVRRDGVGEPGPRGLGPRPPRRRGSPRVAAHDGADERRRAPRRRRPARRRGRRRAVARRRVAADPRRPARPGLRPAAGRAAGFADPRPQRNGRDSGCPPSLRTLQRGRRADAPRRLAGGRENAVGFSRTGGDGGEPRGAQVPRPAGRGGVVGAARGEPLAGPARRAPGAGPAAGDRTRRPRRRHGPRPGTAADGTRRLGGAYRGPRETGWKPRSSATAGRSSTRRVRPGCRTRAASPSRASAGRSCWWRWIWPASGPASAAPAPAAAASRPRSYGRWGCRRSCCAVRCGSACWGRRRRTQIDDAAGRITACVRRARGSCS